MSTQLYWVFYDTILKVQSNPITTEDAQNSIMRMRPGDVSRFLIWSPGWQNWQPLKTYLEGDQKNFVSTFTVSKNLHNKEVAQEAVKEVCENTQTSFTRNSKTFSGIKLDEETISRIVRQEKNEGERFDGDDLTMSNIKKPKLDFSNIMQKPSLDKRETRHDLKIEVLLIHSKGKNFRSRSQNISLSGALLKDSIPFDFYEYPFDVIVVNSHSPDPHNSRVKLKAKTVGDGITQRIQFLDVSSAQKNSLQSLLEFYLKQQDTLRKQKKSA